MAANKELYTVLGVDPSATDAEIKSAFERLEAENPEGTPLHPRIVEAYTVLSDMDSRAAYDITGKVRKNGVRKHTSGHEDGKEKARYTLNTLFLAGAAITTVLFILQISHHHKWGIYEFNSLRPAQIVKRKYYRLLLCNLLNGIKTRPVRSM